MSVERLEAELPQRPLGRENLESLFRTSMRTLAGGVSVVTVGEGEELAGFTATSVTSLSVDPPSLLVCLNKNSASWAAVQRYRRFSVNILGPSHRDIAEIFAGRRELAGGARYTDDRWQRRDGWAPYLSDALAVIDCRLEEAIQRYSHAILIGHATRISMGGAFEPMVYWQSDFRRLQD